MSNASIITLTFCGIFALFGLGLLVVVFQAIRVVPEYQRLAIFRLGRYMGERGPGLVLLLPFIDRGVRLDTRSQVAKLQAQQALFGALGETKTLVQQNGSVELGGEIWAATSTTPLPPGTRVRVVKVVLEVEQM